MADPIPADYPRLTPYLIVDGAAAAIDFYCSVLGASVRGDMMAGPDGKVGHAELQLGDSVLMLADEYPDMNAIGPKGVGGSPVTLHLYVEDVDATFASALAAGATVEQPVEDKFYGDRSGSFVDPWGHRWNIATHVEDVPPDEMARRAAEAMGET
jgi:PhnB protein